MATFLVALLSFTFGAGVAFGAARVLILQVRKDLNGLGCLIRESVKSNDHRYESLKMALVLVSKNDPERRKIAEFLDGRS
jgi:hypothetical protein